MKQGEALSLSSRQGSKLEDLRSRIKANALVQQGEKPSEDAETLIKEFVTLSDEHSILVRRIQLTNMQSTPSGGENLLELIHRREALRRRRAIHTYAADAGTPNKDSYRYTRSELPYESQVNVQDHRKKAEDLDAEIRALDSKIQEANWQIDVLDVTDVKS
jgi:hypothetical protein